MYSAWAVLFEIVLFTEACLSNSDIKKSVISIPVPFLDPLERSFPGLLDLLRLTQCAESSGVHNMHFIRYCVVLRPVCYTLAGDQ